MIVRKQALHICENIAADHLCAITARPINTFDFCTRIVLSLYLIITKFQASSLFVSLYRPVCVGPGWKPRRPVFLLLVAYILFQFQMVPLPGLAFRRGTKLSRYVYNEKINN